MCFTASPYRGLDPVNPVPPHIQYTSVYLHGSLRLALVYQNVQCYVRTCTVYTGYE
ncbi:hypothetical protein DPMN_073078 [Dreissena polymorpha]|uniref:Uncharacterized protein n=1 Tax=Dreissena polymorpha TaxID=45954 RepID=A0A9D4BYH6_DREPO|nr:hypothetical protein DPMN_073078 [Dreissena polymorpha]